MLRHFDVTAIHVNIVYNKYGDVDPNGLLYVLNENKSQLEQQVRDCPGTYVDLVQPLVIRVNQYDTLEIAFTNELCFPAAINIKGLPGLIQTSDGAFVGCNDNSTVAPNETKVYRWEAKTMGGFFFSDLGNPLSSEIGSNVHGLFGAVIVEAPGSTWTDPQTGNELKSGVFADVHHPFLPDFREYVTLFHDEAPVKNRFLEEPWDPMMNMVGMTHSINYRAEPMRNRLHLIEQGIVCPECEGEEVHHDSWVFGDPPPTILPRAYVGDPVRWYAISAGMKETHIFHLHLQQWNSTREDPGTDYLDSIAIGPGEVYDFDVAYGAGSLQKAYGDVIYHCHLYPHFDEGMWGIHRIHNVYEDGSRRYPDGTPITRLVPLPDRSIPELPTPEKPGFPLFIPGKVGERSPVPPIGWQRDFPITNLERNALVENPQLGALFVNPVPKGAKIRRYDIVAIQLPIQYNEANWHDPEGRIYVLAEDEKDILCGKKRPEPLYIHALPYENIEIHFTNKMPEHLGPNAFQSFTETLFASSHVHLVKFDVLSSDGANTGWNYFTGAAYQQTVVFRWYADMELRACFFHDHLAALSNQLHGLFGALIVEPEGSRFLDSHTGKPACIGSQMAIENPYIPSFREFNLAVADWIPAYDRKNKPLNPPDMPGMMEDWGIMAFNYASAPFQIRPGDPADVFSSYVHGDPWTPVFEGYVGDPVRVRLIDGSHEESHAINFNRYKWRKEYKNVNSKSVQQQHIGISEAFTFQFSLEGPKHNKEQNDFDVLYYSGGMDDLWLGVWGMLRVRGKSVKTLHKLCDRPKLKRKWRKCNRKCCKQCGSDAMCDNRINQGLKVRQYHIAAIHTDIIYNKFLDHDPYGITFVPYQDVEKIRNREINPKPFIFTANAGEMVEIKLTNLLPKCMDIPQFPEVPVQKPWPYSNQIGLHSGEAIYDVRTSDGLNVGYNPKQTVGPGESIVYHWYYPEDAKQGLLIDLVDTMNHRKHGAFGAVNIVPPGSITRDNFCGLPNRIGEQLIVTNPYLPSYRLFTVIPHNGIYLVDRYGELLPKMYFEPALKPTAEEYDTEDQGVKGYNLRSEPFYNRLRKNPVVSQVFASLPENKKDPLTPVFYAQKGDPKVMHVVMAGDRSRATSFTVHNNMAYEDSNYLQSRIKGTTTAITVGGNFERKLLDYTAFVEEQAGDYMYQSTNITWDIEQGMWGMMRVEEKESSKVYPLK